MAKLETKIARSLNIIDFLGSYPLGQILRRDAEGTDKRREEVTFSHALGAPYALITNHHLSAITLTW